MSSEWCLVQIAKCKVLGAKCKVQSASVLTPACEASPPSLQVPGSEGPRSREHTRRAHTQSTHATHSTQHTAHNTLNTQHTHRHTHTQTQQTDRHTLTFTLTHIHLWAQLQPPVVGSRPTKVCPKPSQGLELLPRQLKTVHHGCDQPRFLPFGGSSTLPATLCSDSCRPQQREWAWAPLECGVFSLQQLADLQTTSAWELSSARWCQTRKLWMWTLAFTCSASVPEV